MLTIRMSGVKEASGVHTSPALTINITIRGFFNDRTSSSKECCEADTTWITINIAISNINFVQKINSIVSKRGTSTRQRNRPHQPRQSVGVLNENKFKPIRFAICAQDRAVLIISFNSFDSANIISSVLWWVMVNQVSMGFPFHTIEQHCLLTVGSIFFPFPRPSTNSSTFETVRLNTATVYPRLSMFSTRFSPITARPTRPMSALIVARVAEVRDRNSVKNKSPWLRKNYQSSTPHPISS